MRRTKHRNLQNLRVPALTKYQPSVSVELWSVVVSVTQSGCIDWGPSLHG